MDRAAIIQTLTNYFAGRRDVVAAYLFGSVARNQDHPGSDVDVGVILTAAPKDLAAIDVVGDMHADVEALLRKEVDLVVMNGASPDLLHRVLRDGILLHESDHRQRLLFEMQARNEYFDMQPILERYRRAVLDSL